MKTLEEGLHPILESAQWDTLVFQQDNAPIYTLHILRGWHGSHVSTVLEWAPYSPDSNSIEKVWPDLKNITHNINILGENISGTSKTVCQKIG